ncbi:hypothetical protein ALC53_12941 [Atta colombica]|uniref:Uncharacterized protein n=1 Tax=Atta colombica TaxID=520822 RepID=A0A151HYH2_9HYME|nr:hypothetical protein ALC53_12941 [Atta colombica]
MPHQVLHGTQCDPRVLTPGPGLNHATENPGFSFSFPRPPLHNISRLVSAFHLAHLIFVVVQLAFNICRYDRPGNHETSLCRQTYRINGDSSKRTFNDKSKRGLGYQIVMKCEKCDPTVINAISLIEKGITKFCAFMDLPNINKMKVDTIEMFCRSEELDNLTVVFDTIKSIYEELSSDELLSRCLGGYFHFLSQNGNESFNATLWVPKSCASEKRVIDICNFNDEFRNVMEIMKVLTLLVSN